MRLRKSLLLVMYLVPSLAGLFVNYVELLAIAAFLWMTYWMWKSIEGPRARMTPGKSVGYQLIPAYGLYWMFQVYPGFATDFNKHAKSVGESVGAPAPRLSRGLMLAHVVLFMLTASMTKMASQPTYQMSNNIGVAAVLISVWLAAIVVDAIVIGKVCDAVNWLADATTAPLPASPATAPSDSPVKHTRLGITSSILALLMLAAFVVMLASRDAASGAGVDLSWSSLPTLNGASTLLTILLGVVASSMAIAAFGRRDTHKVFAAVGLSGALVLLTVTAALMMSSESGMANSGDPSAKLRMTANHLRLFPIVENGKWGYMDARGRVAILPQFGWADSFSEGLAAVRIGDKRTGKWGYIDKTGKLVINPQFDKVGAFSEGLAWVIINGKYGYVDKTGKLVVNPQYDFGYDYSEGLAMVKLGSLLTGRDGYIDRTGMYAINPQFELAEPFHEGLAAVTTRGGCGYIDKTGKLVINPQFDRACNFSEGLAEVTFGDWQTGKSGYIDKTGKLVINPQFDRTSGFSEGLAAVVIGTYPSWKWGFIDKSGEYAIDPQFDDAGDFSEGLAVVRYGEEYTGESNTGKWGYIDKTGKLVINPQFDHTFGFSGGLAWVNIGGKQDPGEDYNVIGGMSGYIDKTGKYVWGPTE